MLRRTLDKINMNSNEADLPAQNKEIIHFLKEMQRDLAIKKLVTDAQYAMRRLKRGEDNKITLCAFDFAQDIMPLHAIVPDFNGKNYAVFYEVLASALWDKAFGNAEFRDEEYNITLDEVPELTPRLKTVNSKGSNFNVNGLLWQVGGSTEASLSRLRYSLQEDSLYENPPLLAEQWVVERTAYTISALIPGQTTTTRTRNWR